MRPVFFSPLITVLNCGAHRVSLGVFRRRDGRLHCEYAEQQLLPVGSSTESEWLAQAGAALGKFKHRSGPAVLVLPAQRTLLRMLAVPRVGREQAEKIVRFEAGQSLPFALEEMVWGSAETGETAAGRQVVLIATKRALVENLCTAAQAAGFGVKAVWPASLAALASFRLGATLPEQPSLVVLPGVGSTVLAQHEAGRWALRVVADTGPEAGLVREINRTEQYFEQELGMMRPAMVFGSGHDHAACERLAAVLKRPFIACEPVSLDSGAAAMSLLAEPLRVDLLPPMWRAQRRRRRRLPWLVAASILLVAAMAFPVGTAWAKQKKMQREIVALEKQLGDLRARAARNEKQGQRLAEVRREIGRWQAVETGRTHWLKRLADWQERLTKTDNAWLEKVQLLPGTKAGEAPRLVVAGCLLARAQPPDQAGPALIARVQALREDLRQSPFVAGIAAERYDTSRPGLLRFELVLLNKGEEPL